MQKLLNRIQNLQSNAFAKGISFIADATVAPYNTTTSIKVELDYNTTVCGCNDARRFSVTFFETDDGETQDKKMNALCSCYEQAIASKDIINDFNE